MHGGRLGSASHRGPVAAPPAPAARAVSGNLLAAGKPAGDVSGPMLGTAMFDVACLALGPAAPAQQLQARLKELHLAQLGLLPLAGPWGALVAVMPSHLLPACQLRNMSLVADPVRQKDPAWAAAVILRPIDTGWLISVRGGPANSSSEALRFTSVDIGLGGVGGRRSGISASFAVLPRIVNTDRHVM